MIARLWHGRTKVADADRYLEFLKERAIPDYQRIDGNRGVHILRNFEGGVAHFYTLTFWQCEESIRTFAGEDVLKAKYYDEDDAFLLEFEAVVQHFDLVSA